MATNTAMAVFGRDHPNDGGLAGEIYSNPFIRLSENSRPAWIFRPGDYFHSQGKPAPKSDSSAFVLVPTLEHTLEDGLSLMALVLFNDHSWSKTASRMRDELMKNARLEMSAFSETDRSQTSDEVRELSICFPKMILSVFDRNSLIYGHLGALRHYQHAMSVCIPVFTKSFSQWSDSPHITGTIDG